MHTNSMNAAALRSARAVSRLVSWYSGANVAHASVPYVDHARMNMYTIATLNPPHGPANDAWTLDECQSPVKYGTMMNSANGIISRMPQA